MGIRWEDYKNRRFLKILGWAAHHEIKTYSDMRKHLLRAGVIPPHESHEDVLAILGPPEAPLPPELPPEAPVVQKPTKEKKATTPTKEIPVPKRKPRARRSTRKKAPSKTSKK